MSSPGGKDPQDKPRRGPGRPFAPGNTANLKGRPPGIPNRATVEVKELAAKLLGSQEYQASLKARLEAGELAPAVETMLWYYVHGKPRETVAVEGGLTVYVLAGDDEL